MHLDRGYQRCYDRSHLKVSALVDSLGEALHLIGWATVILMNPDWFKIGFLGLSLWGVLEVSVENAEILLIAPKLLN
jgi:hypothetical protein